MPCRENLFAFCQNNYSLGLQSHIPDGLSPQLVAIGKTGAGRIAVCADKEGVNTEVFSSLADHWPH